MGAREHNLRDVTAESIPRDELVVITGLSGSGKSSLAFDTLYAEGQRRYVESPSAYARQFLGQMDKPDVDHIDGLAGDLDRPEDHQPQPALDGGDRHGGLRLPPALRRVGQPYCPICGRPITGQSVEQIADQVLALPEGPGLVLALLVRDRAARDVLEQIRAEGFARVAVDGEVHTLEEAPALDRNRAHTIEAVVDRLIMRDDLRRLTDSLETATQPRRGWSGSRRRRATWRPRRASGTGPGLRLRTKYRGRAGPADLLLQLAWLRAYAPPSLHAEIDPELLVDAERTLAEGALLPWTDRTTDYYDLLLVAIGERHGIDLHKPGASLERQRRLLLEALPARAPLPGATAQGRQLGWSEGVIPQLRRQHATSMSSAVRENVEQFMPSRPSAWPVTAPASSRRRWRSRWPGATLSSSASSRSPTRSPSSPTSSSATPRP